MLRRRILVILSFMLLSSLSQAQTFGDYLDGLVTMPCPKKFKPDSVVNFNRTDLPSHLFNGTDFNLTKQKAFAKLELDEDYPIILIGNISDRGDYFEVVTACSFNNQGNLLSKIVLSHDLVGEGSSYSITPENKIRVASYGASDAVINTYRYENGQFFKEGPREYADADNLPDY